MNLKKEFNRLSGFFGEGMEKAHDTRSEIGERIRGETDALMKRARQSLLENRDAVLSAEQTLERHMRNNATLYLIAGLLLAGLFIARQMMMMERPPTRREW